MQNGVSVTIGPFEVLNYETLKTVRNPSNFEILTTNLKWIFNILVESKSVFIFDVFG